MNLSSKQVFFNLSAVVLLCLFAVSISAKPADDKYTTKYDNVNLDEILNSDRLLKAYYLCLLNKGKCSPDASELKRNLKDAIENDCAKCHEEQKKGAKKVLLFVIRNKQDMWDELKKIYDPTGEYEKKYLEEYKDQLDDEV